MRKEISGMATGRVMLVALDKAIEHGKEKRKPYRGSKAIDCTCRNHGTCKWCEENRKHKFRDKRPAQGVTYEQPYQNADESP